MLVGFHTIVILKVNGSWAKCTAQIFACLASLLVLASTLGASSNFFLVQNVLNWFNGPLPLEIISMSRILIPFQRRGNSPYFIKKYACEHLNFNQLLYVVLVA